MATDAQSLRLRVESFSLDEPGATYPFSARLARENRWSNDYARRVIEEYKRFALLALTSEHQVTPSEQVDQAWHLHLTYTESYWERFCGGVLGRPLHHHPTAGGDGQASRFRAQYDETLQRYREVFGEPPPQDIWPDSERRFGSDLHWERVNTADNWIVPKPWGISSSSGSVVPGWPSIVPAIALLLIGCAASGLPSSFSLEVDHWQLVYLVLCGAIFALALGARMRSRRQTANPEPFPELDGYEVAYLAGGKKLMIKAALGTLAAQGGVRFWQGFEALAFPYRQLAQGHPVEQALWNEVERRPAPLRRLYRVASVAIDRIDARLTALGLIEGRRRFVPLAIALTAPALGAFGLLVGAPMDSFSWGVATLLAALLFVIPRSRRTPRGEAVLSRLRRRHADLEPGRTPASAAPEQLPLAIGLFGPAVLAGSSNGGVMSALSGWGLPSGSARKSTSSGGSAGCGGFFGCGGGDSGGGGCGGGGCGGGGCGG